MCHRSGSRVALVVCSVLALGVSHAAEHAVILLYHHVDDSAPASTSVTREAFSQQLDYLEREAFNVMPLLDLVEALEAGKPVPERSVALTFDDAYRSILSNALPELEARGWPFTVFVSTEGVDQAYSAYLSWDELRELGRRGASIGNHSVSHAHLIREREDETPEAWQRRVSAEIDLARERLAAEVGDYLVPIFAYPYGEYSAEVKAIVAATGQYALGQQSGAIGPTSDFLALPRYPIATGLGLSASDFALRVESRALPVSPVGPEVHIITSQDRPELRLALTSTDDIQLSELACYASGQGRMAVAWRDSDQREFVVRPERALGSGRSKFNCTAPSMSSPGVYYWYAYLWIGKLPDGRWYDE